MAGAQTLALAQVSSVTGRCYECGWGRANAAIEENTLDVAPQPEHAGQGAGEESQSTRVEPEES